MNQKTLFIIINLVLGSILLYSYYRGITNNPDIAPKLWGGIPIYLTKYIVSSMFLGAVGYFIFTYYILFEINHETILVFNKYSFQLFIILYLLILIPSSFWIDLSLYYIQNPNTIIWYLIVLILYTVGIASLLLLLSILNISPNNDSVLYKLSVLGCIFFTFHTLFLDGLLWTFSFHK